jgi:hypothetical protein
MTSPSERLLVKGSIQNHIPAKECGIGLWQGFSIVAPFCHELSDSVLDSCQIPSLPEIDVCTRIDGLLERGNGRLLPQLVQCSRTGLKSLEEFDDMMIRAPECPGPCGALS